MMRDYISIGPSPTEEECTQVGEDNYIQDSRIECKRFIFLLRKKFGPEPDGAQLTIKANPHDFGTYLDVVCYYDKDNEEATKYAFACEGHTPKTWDDEESFDWKESKKSILQSYIKDSPC